MIKFKNMANVNRIRTESVKNLWDFSVVLIDEISILYKLQVLELKILYFIFFQYKINLGKIKERGGYSLFSNLIITSI